MTSQSSSLSSYLYECFIYRSTFAFRKCVETRRHFVSGRKQWIAKDIPTYGDQSKRAKFAVHWFVKYWTLLDFIASIAHEISMNALPSILQSSKTKYLSFYLRWRWSPRDIDVILLRCIKSHWRFDETLRAVGRYLHDSAPRRHTC